MTAAKLADFGMEGTRWMGEGAEGVGYVEVWQRIITGVGCGLALLLTACWCCVVNDANAPEEQGEDGKMVPVARSKRMLFGLMLSAFAILAGSQAAYAYMLRNNEQYLTVAGGAAMANTVSEVFD